MISTSHGLPVPLTQKNESQCTKPSKADINRPSQQYHPPIIARFANRDKRNELYFKKKLLNSNRKISSNFGKSEISFKENLTGYRKMLFDAVKSAKEDLNFKFLWTSRGRICLRQDIKIRVIFVNLLFGLAKLSHSRP